MAETLCGYRDPTDERRCPDRQLAWRGFHLCTLAADHDGEHRCFCDEIVRDPNRTAAAPAAPEVPRGE